MTITLQAVNELIASLENAGELSIREQKFLKLAKAYQRLAAENVALKSAITDHSHSVHFCEVCGKDDPCSTDDVCYALKDIPDTDRIVAEAEARGVEKAIVHLEKKFSNIAVQVMNLQWLADSLREGADK
ncbi:hypothetical protein [Klebsiella pneumoniae]|uniref:hypothetical protein n=1 Tax=Klebsiella pneumoniae TaxID=573 RepID=UPI0027320DB3|nr:hypothetical protein [Klebsiella pneumoniae]MDP1178798.1 hypothetical protein [Klebsiella pneumoniae]HBW2841691.1 hypothetical protein [Klebsiella pneumoniae]HDY9286362.1 hypothetical protein [Klebsiella pneumoniae]